eukprot:TRINITY_DN9410_c0_g1_i1.p1 TRINITY_DN9410_c0_g1~~TRINITY_DN9410_c0_g1_i1.p1  ORF type:complete len:632 (-),score=194.64 TRINITY_DN9410_c0_g1_i1:44-1939(-)
MWGLFGRKKKVDSSADLKKRAAPAKQPAAAPAAAAPAAPIPASNSASSVSSSASSKPTVTVVSGARKELPTSALAAIQRKETRAWTVDEVGIWLEFLELGEYTKQFADNSIAGADLLDLEDEDLLSINVRKLGHRKKILAKIRHMKASGAMSSHDDETRSSHSENSHTDTHSSSTPSGTFILKCAFDGDVVAIKAQQDITLAELHKKLKKEFGKTLDIKYTDKDGDTISITKDDHLTTVLKSSPTKTIKLQLSEKKIELGAAQTSVLENLVDGVVIIDNKGNILFVNKSTETLFGYSREEVVNKNVSILMPKETASVHDTYIKRYLQTGEGRIIGLGRDVEAKKKNGTTFSVFLTLSETKNSKQHTFTGLIRESTQATSAAPAAPAVLDASAQFSILENILDACVVCDEKGLVQFFNRKAIEMLGFSSSDIIGKNVKAIMPNQYAEEHDKYIASYLSTGKAKIIGVGRDVVAQKKDGSFLPINLSVTEQYFAGGRRLFTGILREFEERSSQEKSVLQQEREVLDNLVVPAVIIGEKGNILAVNSAAQTLLGYTMIELINKNIKMIMTPTDAAHHDAYLATYLRTNRARVLGIGRDVVAQRKNGTLVNVRLSVTEKLDEQDKRIFTGILQKL